MSETSNYGNEAELTRPIEASPDKPIVLTSNSYLDKLTEMIQNTPFDWDYIKAKADAQNFNESGNRVGKSAEIHLHHVLQKASQLEDFQKRLIISPVPKETTTQHFHFHSRKGSFIAKDLDTQQDIAEYDAITQVDGLPVVWEVKTGKRNRSSKKKGDLNAALTNEKVNAILAPLREFFNTDAFGYVIITMPENIFDMSSFQNGFRQRGGILIGLPTNYTEFQQNADIPLEDKLVQLQNKYNQEK